MGSSSTISMENNNASVVVGDDIAVQDSIQIEIVKLVEIVVGESVRPIAYFYKDSYLPESYPVYEARISAWWMDGGVKLHELLAHFKKRHTVKQACYFTGITEQQYKDFRDLHPWLTPSIRLYRTLVPMAISDIILEAALGNKERGIPGNAKIALGAARLYPNIETDPDFADQDQMLVIPPGGSSLKATNEAILNSSGKIIASRSSLELLKHHD